MGIARLLDEQQPDNTHGIYHRRVTLGFYDATGRTVRPTTGA
jgi:hypothetical protein